MEKNEIAHEYETEDIPQFFAPVLQTAPSLFSIIDKLNAYCARLFN
jgi:hypothetical protein